MIVMRIKLYRGSSGALRAEFADGLDSVSQNNAGSNVVEVVPDKSVALSENEALRIGYATSINENDPNTLNVGFTLMPFYPENGVWRAFVPPLVCKTRGKWLLNLQVVSDWDDETEEFQYISHTVEPLEFSVKAVIQDDSGNYPNDGDILALYEEARRLENSTGRVEAEANGEVTIATIEINNPNTTLAFKNLEGMTEIDWGDGTINSELTHTYENLGVYYCRIYGLVSIGEEAFKGSIPSSNYTPITHIKISNKVTSIGDNAFTYTKLRSIEIPNSVTYIGSSFDNSNYLEKIVIPESVTYIDVGAFNMCSNLKIVELKGAPPQQIYSGDIFSFADKLEKIIVPYGMVEAYKSAPMWSDYATLIDCLVYQSDLDTVNADLRSLIGGNTSLMLSNTERITAVEEKITENREEINKDIKNLYAITAQGGLYTMLEVEQAFSSRETADGENIVDGQYTAPKKIQGDTVACDNLIPYPYYNFGTTTRNGVTRTIRADGGIELKGVCTETFGWRIIDKPHNFLRLNKEYTISLIITGTGASNKIYLMMVHGNGSATGSASTTNGSGTFILTKAATAANYVDLILLKGDEEIDCVVYPMLNEGTTALPYQPYFTGLKNAYFKGIKSTGKNLFDPKSTKYSGSANVLNQENNEVTVSASRAGSITYESANFKLPNEEFYIGKTIYISAKWSVSANNKGLMRILWFDKDKAIASAGDIIAKSSGTVASGIIGNKPTGTAVLCVSLYANSSGEAIIGDTVTYSDIMVSFDNVAYSSYTEDTYELPEAVELGKWDYIDVENKKVVRKTYQLTVNGDGAGPKKTPISIYQSATTGVSSILCPFYGNEGGLAMTAGRDGVVVAQNNICEYASITGGDPDSGYTTLQLVGVQVTTVEEAKALLAANPITFAYESFANTKTTVLEETPERYQAWKNGSETVVQGDTDNSEYGAMTTVTTEYFKLTEV